MISYGKQSINQSDIDAVVSVLKSDYLTQGDQVPNFETAVCKYTGANYSVAVNSGTSALHVACLSLGLEQGDTVWVPAISFVASSNCALYCGAKVDFLDVDPFTGNLDLVGLENKINQTEKSKIPKIIIVVHMAGNPCDLKKIYELVSPHNIKIIEDASHALGAEYKSNKIGSCEYSDITTLSFHPVKIITTGEGGMALTNKQCLADDMRSYASHGITKDTDKMVLKAPWSYEQQSLGFNYRMSDIQAALGISQLKRIDHFIEKRKSIAEYYDKNIKSDKIKCMHQNQFGVSSYHLYMVKVNPDFRRDLFEHMRKKNIGVQVHYYPIPLQPYYKKLGYTEDNLIGSIEYYNQIISIPIYPTLQYDQIDEIIGVINEY